MNKWTFNGFEYEDCHDCEMLRVCGLGQAGLFVFAVAMMHNDNDIDAAIKELEAELANSQQYAETDASHKHFAAALSLAYPVQRGDAEMRISNEPEQIPVDHDIVLTPIDPSRFNLN